MAFEISRPIHRRGALLSGLAVAGTTLLPRAVAEPEPLNGRLSGNISPVHDPCMIRAGDTYYVFSTNQPGAGGGQNPATIYAKSQPWLDLSASYKLSDRTTVTFDATNLLDSYFQDSFGKGALGAVYPRDTRRFDQTLELGVRYRL